MSMPNRNFGGPITQTLGYGIQVSVFFCLLGITAAPLLSRRRHDKLRSQIGCTLSAIDSILARGSQYKRKRAQLDTQGDVFIATSEQAASVKALTGAHLRSNLVEDGPEDRDALRKAVLRLSLLS